VQPTGRRAVAMQAPPEAALAPTPAAPRKGAQGGGPHGGNGPVPTGGRAA
jgi:hypothetical protein